MASATSVEGVTSSDRKIDDDSEVHLVKHWDDKYASDPAAASFSWTQEKPELDLKLVDMAINGGNPKSMTLFDAGGGASQFAQLAQAELGVGRCVVLDLSAQALGVARDRAKRAGICVEFQQGNILDVDVPLGSVHVWHDRAVLHFLSDDKDVQAYADIVTNAVAQGGAAVIGTFDLDGGPLKCSGLPVRRWDAKGLQELFGKGFRLEHEEKEVHRTPGGREQKFVFVVLRRL